MSKFYTKLVFTLFILGNAVLLIDDVHTHAELRAVKNGMCVLPEGYKLTPIVERLDMAPKPKTASFNPQNVN